jgi:hypothetical protein
VDEKSVLVSHDDPLREVCWYFKRNNATIFVAPGEVRYETSCVDARNRVVMDSVPEPSAGLAEFSPYLIVCRMREFGRGENFSTLEIIFVFF